MIGPELSLMQDEIQDRAPGQPPADTWAPVSVAHIVDQYNRYPGESVTFFTRLEINEASEDITLRIFLPPELSLENYWPPKEQPQLVPQLETSPEGQYLAWTLAGPQPAGRRFEYRTEARIGPLWADEFLSSQALVYDPAGRPSAEASVRLAVHTQGKFMRYLPALYEQDDFMRRFLMIFESVWAPIRAQSGTIHHYFDPGLTPAYFLPWLATWLGVESSDKWDSVQLRQLLRHAVQLHRSRGTRPGLQQYLELYTGQQAEIVESFENFLLGEESALGPGLSLGDENEPHHFTVTLKLPPLAAESQEQQRQHEAVRRRTLEAIIDQQKPAHTTYTLNLETFLEKTTGPNPVVRRT
ncbi:MAG TPA: phage tail protein [Anaerolineae bacterium]|nr:phage tail protein [Anaerolineae bacterium]